VLAMAETPQNTQNTTTPARDDVPVGDLVKQAAELTAKLVRSEIRLAQLELQDKAKHAGIGVGLFGAAGVVALFGVGAIVAMAILLLTTAVDHAWLAALIVGAVLFAAAGVVAVTGKKQVDQATPAAPEEALDSVQDDVQEIKARSRRP
jgi:uncharacterized membrane protein YqjE